MVTLYVTYAGDASVHFDREYWINTHLPLVRETWGPFGMIGTGGYFPSGDGAGFIAICPCVFRDEAALHAALEASETKRVMDDIQNFTPLQPDHNIARPL